MVGSPSVIGMSGWSRLKVEVSRDQARLKTSNSSLESGTLTTSSSFVLVVWEEVATPVVYGGGENTFGMPSGMGSVVSVPSGTGSGSRKLEAAMLIRCNRGSLALMTNFGTKKPLEIGT